MFSPSPSMPSEEIAAVPAPRQAEVVQGATVSAGQFFISHCHTRGGARPQQHAVGNFLVAVHTAEADAGTKAGSTGPEAQLHTYGGGTYVWSGTKISCSTVPVGSSHMSWGKLCRPNVDECGTFSDAEFKLYQAAMKNKVADVQELLFFGAEPDRYRLREVLSPPHHSVLDDAAQGKS
jgi:hypothetical protein